MSIRIRNITNTIQLEDLTMVSLLVKNRKKEKTMIFD